MTSLGPYGQPEHRAPFICVMVNCLFSNFGNELKATFTVVQVKYPIIILISW